jgi:hypothetical protein
MNNQRQIAAYKEAVNEAMLTLDRLIANVDYLPADINWTDVGTAKKIASDLKAVSDFFFNEGEHDAS